MNIKSSLKKLAMKPLRGYKKYVSPYKGIGGECIYTPSCSLYTAEAVKEYGALEGSLMGAMRLLRCNAQSKGGYDPVIKKGEDFPDEYFYEHPPVGEDSILHHCHIPQAKSELKIEELEKRSIPEKILDKGLILGMEITGAVGGGVAGAIGGLLAGAFTGGYTGMKAGSGDLDNMEKTLTDKYTAPRHREDQLRNLKIATRPLGGIGKEVHDFIVNKLHSELLAKVIGTPVGIIAGTVLGAAGGMFLGTALGGKMFGLMGKNFMKDKLGLLPEVEGQKELLEHYHFEE